MILNTIQDRLAVCLLACVTFWLAIGFGVKIELQGFKSNYTIDLKQIMKKNIKIPKEILATIDFNNTVMGGSVEPAVKINEGKEAFEVLVKVPGLSPENLQIDIVDNRLWLYNLQPVLSNNEIIGFMPKTITNMYLPENVDRELISAKYEQGGWKIVIPIDTQAKGFNKHIDVEY